MFQAAGSSSGGSGFTSILILVVIFGLMWFFLLRPMAKRQRAAQAEQQRMRTELKVGVEVVTAGGLYGTVTELEDDESMVLEIAENIFVRFDRNAVSRVIPAEPETAEDPVTAESFDTDLDATAHAVVEHKD